MKKQEIVTKLKEWFDIILNKYDDVSFRYEYNDRRGVYLVSYTAPEEVLSSEAFCRDMMEFEDKMDYLYGEDAPLFTEKETLFTLSEEAENILGMKCSLDEQEYHIIAPKEIEYGFSYGVSLAA